MARPRKEGQFLNCYVEQGIIDALQAYVDKAGVSKTFVVEHALSEYLARINEKWSKVNEGQ